MSNTFAAASHLSVHLARWENIRTPPDGRIGPPAGSPTSRLVGADEGRHGSEFSSQLATEFIAVGAHPDADSARACAAAAIPEFDDAAEVWSAAFEPLRSIGELNWVGGGRFEATGSRADGPLAVMRSAGWDLGPRSTPPGRSRSPVPSPRSGRRCGTTRRTGSFGLPEHDPVDEDERRRRLS